MLRVLLSVFYCSTLLHELPAFGMEQGLPEDTTNYRIHWLFQENLKNPDEQTIIDLSSLNEDNTFIKIESDKPFILFNNKRLIGSSEDNSFDILLNDLNHWLTSDTLIVFAENLAKNLNYGFYKRERIPSYPAFAKDIQVETKGTPNTNGNLFILLLICFAILLSALKVNFSKKFQDVFSISRIFSLRPVEGDNLRLRLFDQDGLLAAVIYTFAMAIVLYLYNSEHNAVFFKSHSINYLEFFQSWVFIIILLAVKIFLIFLFSGLYKISRINTFYIKELINISMFFVTLLVLVTIFIYFYSATLPNFWFSFVRNTLLIMYLIRMVLIYFKILKLSGFTNLYLFSYFCATEIFPFVIGLKYFY